MSFTKLTDLDLAGKRVLIRADLNVPVKDGKVRASLDGDSLGWLPGGCP